MQRHHYRVNQYGEYDVAAKASGIGSGATVEIGALWTQQYTGEEHYHESLGRSRRRFKTVDDGWGRLAELQRVATYHQLSGGLWSSVGRVVEVGTTCWLGICRVYGALERTQLLYVQ